MGPHATVESGQRRVKFRAVAALVGSASFVAGSSSSGPLELSPDPADFGTVMVGELSELTITAANDTNHAVSIAEVRFDPGYADLSVVADTCTGSELDVDELCTLTLRFQPVEEMIVDTELVITTDQGSAATPVWASALFGAEAVPPTYPEVTAGAVEPPTAEPPAEGVEPTEPELGDSAAEPPSAGTTAEGIEPGSSNTEPPGTIVPGDAAPTGTVPSDPDLGACEQRVRQFGLSGSFVPEVTMTEGTAETVGLALAIRGTPIELPPGAGTSPTTIVEFESDGCVITAQLVGNGFEIAPAELVEQSFIGRDHLEWSWQVTPTRSGNLELQAQVTPWLVSADGTRHAGGASTYYADIDVTAKPKPERSVGYRINEVVGSPAGGTLVGVLAAGLSATGLVSSAKKRRVRTKDKEATTDDPKV